MTKEAEMLCPFCGSNKIYEQVTKEVAEKVNGFSEGPDIIEIDCWSNGIFMCGNCGFELHTFEDNEEELCQN